MRHSNYGSRTPSHEPKEIHKETKFVPLSKQTTVTQTAKPPVRLARIDRSQDVMAALAGLPDDKKPRK